jgi:hypothetical protein
MIYRVFKNAEPGVQICQVAASTLKNIGDKISLTIDEKDVTFVVTKTNKPSMVENRFVTDIWVKEYLP